MDPPVIKVPKKRSDVAPDGCVASRTHHFQGGSQCK